MNIQIPTQPKTAKRRAAPRASNNGAPRELNIEFLIRTSDLAECAVYLIEQSATILQTNADLLEETAVSIGGGSLPHEAAAARMIERANVLRLNASRIRQRAAPFRRVKGDSQRRVARWPP